MSYVAGRAAVLRALRGATALGVHEKCPSLFCSQDKRMEAWGDRSKKRDAKKRGGITSYRDVVFPPPAELFTPGRALPRPLSLPLLCPRCPPATWSPVPVSLPRLLCPMHELPCMICHA